MKLKQKAEEAMQRGQPWPWGEDWGLLKQCFEDATIILHRQSVALGSYFLVGHGGIIRWFQREPRQLR